MFDFEKRLPAIGKQTILCIGDVMLDEFVYGEVSRISPEAPVPVLAVGPNGASEIVVGGAGNVARNIASLGARCIFVGVVGKDGHGRSVKSALSRRKDGSPASGGRSVAATTRKPVSCRGITGASLARRLGGCAADRR